ncbi:hypothetical protein [Paracoccus fistulariae]|uniref:Uncharacterized protein n=1 Tax=Paracoccus fistulariae TaxID=658446 RepID=A0ABY7SK33_9RHOB|nr:hypothetical protein [Paracoccus fistulariae]MDB6180596.1 hypothetical protein [Paracoccus fistulariae]WCR07166.1 hypothetical protein JHX87_17195 [Paracoccus fistulariae]
MQKLLQLLIAAACMMILAVGFVFLNGERKSYLADKEREQAAEMVRDSEAAAWVEVQKRKIAAEIAECKSGLQRYDLYNETAAFIRRVEASGQALTGESLQAAVAQCREIVGE